MNRQDALKVYEAATRLGYTSLMVYRGARLGYMVIVRWNVGTPHECSDRFTTYDRWQTFITGIPAER